MRVHGVKPGAARRAWYSASVRVKTWMIKAAPAAVEAASALWAAIFNLAIGRGALAGGLVVATRRSEPIALT
ncbi:hypothetical protein [Nocardia cyriacigeorgica]|uniref:Putative arabinose transporter n=1 Tax=Nocardia cyriacigeorgica TaxID=135487 RepID=A0A4U8W826_9NOCA|nr:hypothetical protein [Nocardia cyriacigeorgica]VFA97798.1 putative arabinose transporter [Nocardia cyriacigeorgica]